LLLQDLGEQLDPSLDPVLIKAMRRTPPGTPVRVNSEVQFNENFQLYMTTELPNPHYLPQDCIKVTLINFSVTTSGLEDQLLGLVVSEERPELEQQRSMLIVQMARDAKELEELEEKLLQLLASSDGASVLDDESLVDTLAAAKVTALQTKARIEEREVTKAQLFETMREYLPVAVRGSLLYFVIVDLAKIEAMYQFSLSYVVAIFMTAVRDAKPGDTLEARLENLITHTTHLIVQNVNRSLFDRHKVAFGALIARDILRTDGDLDAVEWHTLLHGTPASFTDDPGSTEGLPLDQSQRRLASYCSQELPAFANMLEHFKANASLWLDWMRQSSPWSLPPPKDFAEDSSIRMQLLVKVLRPELLLGAIDGLTASILGDHFIERPPLELSKAFDDSSASIPLLFILSSGSDPMEELLRLSHTMGFDGRLHDVSLGQGQGPVAEALISASRTTGDWVLLQNCHLATSWMPNLDLICELLRTDNALNPTFRLWLTSFPSPAFPVPVLQNSVKMTYTAPKGLRAKLTSTWNAMSPEVLTKCSACKAIYQRLLFGLTFFHALVQERSKFGPFGWNTKYEFNETDLEVSMETLIMILEEKPPRAANQVAWEALIYITGSIHYGGRVTDEWDRRCLLSVLQSVYTESALSENFSYGDVDAYLAPSVSNVEGYLAYVERLPLNDDARVFGLHGSAQMMSGLTESSAVLRLMADVQPLSRAAPGLMSEEERVSLLANQFEEQMPSELKETEASASSLPAQDVPASAMQLVLLHEMERFNTLLRLVAKSLKDVQLAVAGKLLLTPSLERLFASFIVNQVPELWGHAAYPSLKSLSAWFQELIARVGFMRTWLRSGPPKVWKLPFFFFPQGFLTGVLQAWARKLGAPIDSLSFSFSVREDLEVINSEHHEFARGGDDDLDDEASLEVRPSQPSARSSYAMIRKRPLSSMEGVLVDGLFLTGAQFSRRDGVLRPPRNAKQLVDPLPPIFFEVVTEVKETSPRSYECPLYKTAARTGTLTTTGASTNFVIALDLPTHQPPSVWVRMGVAALCAPDS